MRTFIVWFLLAASLISSRAGGLIIVHDWPAPPPRIFPPPRIPRPVPPPRVHFPLAPLEIASEKIDARVKDQVASVTIDQEFYNPNDRQLEGTFLFPIPKGAHLDKFKMEVGGRMVEPELLSADKARRIYQDIVRAAKDPALLEYDGRDCLKLRIFPIEPHSRKKITLSYTQLLKQDSGLVEFIFPLTPEKYSAKPIERISLAVDLETTTPLKTVYSPSHAIELSRPAARRATVRLDEQELGAEKEFQLLYGFEKSEVALQVLTHRDGEGEGYFLLFAAPGIDAPDRAVVAKDVAFVLDTSGSMSGKKIEQARNALLFCVRNLNAQDRFEILRFSTETEPLFRELRAASRENISKAESFIEGLQARNGTAIDEALRQALELRAAASERPFIVVFLTDGLPTVGETREEKILAHVKERSGSTRVFCFGIGNDVNTHLLDKIAEHTRAFTQYVRTGEDIEVKVSSFFSKIRDPLLADLKLDFGEEIRVNRLYPTALPDLFKGEQLIVAGRYKGAGKAIVTLRGSVNGETKTFTEKVEFPESASDHDFIPRLWATRRVGALLDEIRLNGDSAELRDEVTELARRYGIVTPYTAYLIMEDEARRSVPLEAQTLPEAARQPVVREQMRTEYMRLQREKSGESAVAAAQANQSLSRADNAAYAARESRARAFAPSPMLSGAARVSATAPAPMATPAPGGAQVVQQHASKFVAGRSFYQNGNQWVDTQIQKLMHARRERIQFNSDAYFAFASANKDLAPILALGPRLQFIHHGQVIEIHE